MFFNFMNILRPKSLNGIPTSCRAIDSASIDTKYVIGCFGVKIGFLKVYVAYFTRISYGDEQKMKSFHF